MVQYENVVIEWQESIEVKCLCLCLCVFISVYFRWSGRLSGQFLIFSFSHWFICSMAAVVYLLVWVLFLRSSIHRIKWKWFLLRTSLRHSQSFDQNIMSSLRRKNMGKCRYVQCHAIRRIRSTKLWNDRARLYGRCREWEGGRSEDELCASHQLNNSSLSKWYETVVVPLFFRYSIADASKNERINNLSFALHSMLFIFFLSINSWDRLVLKVIYIFILCSMFRKSTIPIL